MRILTRTTAGRAARIALAALLAAALVTQTGCLVRRERLEGAGEGEGARTVENSVSLDGATEGEVVVMMGAGDLAISGGAREGKLLDAEFEFAPARLAPVFEPATLGDRKQVVIRHDRADGFRGLDFARGRIVSEWDLRLTEEVPLERLSVSMGAGEADLDLAGVDVEELSLNLGAGDATIDLSGERTRDIDGNVQAGAGAITIRFPKDVGVRVMGRQDGVGEWDAPGFAQDGNYFVNDAYETADVRIELNVQRGVGEVTLELVD